MVNIRLFVEVLCSHSKRISSWLAVFTGVVVLPCTINAEDAGHSSLVYPGASGRLLYVSQLDGDRLADFSMVGYRYGEAAIPDIAETLRVEPGPGDDSRRIQAAINHVSRLPIGDDGFRGAVVLGAGTFEVGATLVVSASGVVLRGAGDEQVGGTVLFAPGKKRRPVIRVDTSAGDESPEATGPKVGVIDKYVPIGSWSFRVADASVFAAGDDVIVSWLPEQSWISVLGMDRIPPDGEELHQWNAESQTLRCMRQVTRVEGDRIFLNAPVQMMLNQKYGKATVAKYVFPERLTNIGIEGLRGVSAFDPSNPKDEKHATQFIEISRAEHGWVRDVTGVHFSYGTVLLNAYSKNYTVINAHSLEPVSKLEGGRRYPFCISDSQFHLLRDLTSRDGRHDFIWNTPSVGPNVFYNCKAVNSHNDTGPHQRWSSGGLLDNVSIPDNHINVRNRGNFGTGHGWAGANFVIWNCVAEEFIVQNPPTAQNWVIGSVGEVGRPGSAESDGIFDAHGHHVEPTSLYLSQLKDRRARPAGEYREYVLGDYDNFTNDGAGSVDVMEVTDGIRSNVIETHGLDITEFRGLDDPATKGGVPLSFAFGVEPGERVYHAVMTLAVLTSEGSLDEELIWIGGMRHPLRLVEHRAPARPADDTRSVVMVEFDADLIDSLASGRLEMIVDQGVAVDWARLVIYIGGS